MGVWVDVGVNVGGNGVTVSVGGIGLAVGDGVKVKVTLGITWVGCSVGSEELILHPDNRTAASTRKSKICFNVLLKQDLLSIIRFTFLFVIGYPVTERLAIQIDIGHLHTAKLFGCTPNLSSYPRIITIILWF